MEQQDQRRLVDIAIGLGLAGAFIGVVFAMTSMWRYESAAGPTEASPPIWPVASAIPRTEGTATLVMFAHPRCPCTRASVSELAKVMAHGGREARVFVAFLGTEDPAFARSGTWDAAQEIPGVQVIEDKDGLEMKRFGALTSGHVVFYDEYAQLRFSGGITGARGHVGDNAGATTIIDLLTAGQAPREQTPVFGCALQDAPLAASVQVP